MLNLSQFIKENTWSTNTRNNTQYLIDKNAAHKQSFYQFAMLIQSSEGKRYEFEGYVYHHVPSIGRMKNQIIYRNENLPKERRLPSC